MKRLILISIPFLVTGMMYWMISYSGNVNPTNIMQDHLKTWLKIDSLLNEGLPKSAIKMLDELEKSVQTEANHTQYIRVLIYRMKITGDFDEDPLEKAIEFLKNGISSSKEPSRSVLHSMLAELYKGYYRQNRYIILERTEMAGDTIRDITTWTAKRFVDRIISHYDASLASADILKKVNVRDFEDVLIIRDGSEKLRPSLYDLLAHRAIDFYVREDAGISRPEFAFRMDDPVYFSPDNEFTGINIETLDSSSFHYKALRIFRDILRFHINDDDPSSLIDADLERLEFVYRHNHIPNTDSLYLHALISMAEKYDHHPSNVNISLKIALHLQNIARKYRPLESDNFKWELKEALAVLRNAIGKFPESPYAGNCNNLVDEILSSSIQLKTEADNIPDNLFRIKVTYTNAPLIKFRVVAVNHNELLEWRQKMGTKELAAKLLAMKANNEWVLELPDDGDFQKHEVEVVIPGQRPGFYVITAEKQDAGEVNPDSKIATIAYAGTWISNIAYINRKTNDGSEEFFLMHRVSGEPLGNVVMETFFRRYDYRSRKYITEPYKTYTSDKNGYIKVSDTGNPNSRSSFVCVFNYNGEILGNDASYYINFVKEPEPRFITRTTFFTDRAIYRPGQTVYFKGIILESDGKDHRLLSKHKTTVKFVDVNNQKITSLKLHSNEFGSVNGAFVIPHGLLTGNMQIRNESGSVSFSVEEYKRPTFKVEFEPSTATYKLDEEVIVSGLAEAYTGNPVQDAKVKYRVVRQAMYPVPMWYFGRIFPPPSPAAQISSGEITTDADGRFSIGFKALRDESAGSQFRRASFNFNIIVDVTDMAGETRSSSHAVNISDVALFLSATIPQKILRKTIEIPIESKNIQGVHVNAIVDIKIEQLQQPSSPLKKRLWVMPDRYLLGEDEFKRMLPGDEYKNETYVPGWKSKKTLVELTLNTSTEKEIEIDGSDKWETGVYKVVLSATDTFGSRVESVYFFEYFDQSSKSVPANTYFFSHMATTSLQPGDMAYLFIGASQKSRALLEIYSNIGLEKREWLSLKKGIRKIEFPVMEHHRGGLSVRVKMVLNDRIYSENYDIDVPWDNEKLDISFETFRDFLLPGEKEEWRIIIKDNNENPVFAEVLTSLYDASLDQFRRHAWNFGLQRNSVYYPYWNSRFSDTRDAVVFSNRHLNRYMNYSQGYDQLNWYGFNPYRYRGVMKFLETGTYNFDGAGGGDVLMLADVIIKEEDIQSENNEVVEIAPSRQSFDELEQRTVFNETAFFYPNLRTNENGELVISFKMPDDVTTWKLLGLAHTTDLKHSLFKKELVTRKELMIQAAMPRFLREGDSIVLTAKVTNLSDKMLTGSALLEISSLDDNEIGGFIKADIVQQFSVEEGAVTILSWPVDIPEEFTGPLVFTVKATAGNFSDGEERIIPVLPNRMLVIETLPFNIRAGESKSITFNKLKESGSSNTLNHHKLTLEVTSNPAWYALQALPYLMEYPYECTEQAFSRYYANAIATHIVNSNDKIKRVFDQWKNYEPDALLSNLEKNQDLKYILLEETPWLLQAKSETERKKRIALLFDFNRMAGELGKAFLTVEKNQSVNGGWPWFKGMPESRYISQHIVAGFGHLDQMGVVNKEYSPRIQSMLSKAMMYLDNKIVEDYKKLKKNYKGDLEDYRPGNLDIHYLYMRTMFLKDHPVPGTTKTAYDFYFNQARKYWVKYNLYLQGMIGIADLRSGHGELSSKILKSLKEKALHSEEFGMYWRDLQGGYYWYQAAIETQALLIEFFEVAQEDAKLVDDMKIWLLKQKQTQDWGTTKATTEACYALLMRGDDWLSDDKLLNVTMGDIVVDPTKMDDVEVQAGTGYFRTSWNAGEITPDMGDIKLRNDGKTISWGGIYWQYYEQLDKITPHASPLSVKKQLFLERITPAGIDMVSLKEDTKLTKGNRIKVRIEIFSDRDLEYVHLKDMRAAGLEPENVLSGSRWKGGLSYYESTKDASSNFFINWLPKGTHVFEYSLLVAQEGEFSNGIATIQCMYAPEFAAHSEGVRLTIND